MTAYHVKLPVPSPVAYHNESKGEEPAQLVPNEPGHTYVATKPVLRDEGAAGYAIPCELSVGPSRAESEPCGLPAFFLVVHPRQSKYRCYVCDGHKGYFEPFDVVISPLSYTKHESHSSRPARRMAARYRAKSSATASTH